MPLFCISRKAKGPMGLLKNLVEHRGIEPLTSGLQILHDAYMTWNDIMIIAFNQVFYRLQSADYQSNMVHFRGTFFDIM